MLDSKKTSQIILVITAVLCSRAMFSFFNDPEGPNVLIVSITAISVYFLSLIAYTPTLSGKLSAPQKLLLAICIQIVVLTTAYSCLR